MTKIIVCGVKGRMGKVVVNLSKNFDVKIVAGIDIFAEQGEFDFPVYKDFDSCKEICDVVVDFSSPKALDDILAFCKKNKTNLVLSTTGYTKEQRQQIEDACKDIAIFQSFSMAFGINVLAKLCKKANELLGDQYDIEIVEKHHNQKVDAPSGTAILRGEAITCGNDDNFVFGRSGKDAKRKQGEISFSAIRGGNIAGEHEVMFIGQNEIVTLTHTSQSRDVFGDGALRAANFIAGKPNGKYNMEDLVESL